MTDLAPYLGRITKADARHLPADLDNVADVAVTSSPYWGLRDYGDDPDEIGRHTIPAFLDDLDAALAEIERLLKPDGLLWWNIGDTRTGSGGAGGDYSSGRTGKRPFRQAANGLGLHRGQWAMIPHRFALRAQDAGWLVLADVTWSKGKVRLRNGVPELVTRRRPEDLKHVRRPGISSERIFLLARTLKARKRFRPSMLVETGDVWTFPPDGDSRRPKHEAPFPDELVRRCILPTTLPGDVVLDPFAGSGTTLRVAAEHGRQAIGFDLYADPLEAEEATG